MKKISIFCFLAITFLCLLAFSQETITLSTYYPAPFGVYKRLATQTLGVGDNDGSGGIDANDVPSTPGDVWISGSVGIGKSNPDTSLDVAGKIKADAYCSATGHCFRFLGGYANVNYAGGGGHSSQAVVNFPVACQNPKVFVQSWHNSAACQLYGSPGHCNNNEGTTSTDLHAYAQSITSNSFVVFLSADDVVAADSSPLRVSWFAMCDN